MGCFQITAALLFTVITLVHASASNVTSTTTTAANSKWQSFKNELQIAMKRIAIFFSNDNHHTFGKDIPETMSENEDVRKDYSETDGVNNVENKETEIKSIKFDEACLCINYTCGCCQHLEEPSIHLNSTLCANITYLSEDIGLSLTVTVNDFAIFNETVSVRNPPPICLGVPYVKEFANACFRLYDIDATRSHFHACAQVEARMKHILIAKYELGCFDIGPFHLPHYEIPSQFQEPSVMLV